MSDYLHQDNLERLGAGNLINQSMQLMPNSNAHLQVGFKKEEIRKPTHVDIPRLTSFD